MEMNTGWNTAEARSVETMMITWPECFYKETEAEMRFALLKEAEKQELTPEENTVRRFLLEHRHPGYPKESPLIDHYLKLWFFCTFAADSIHGGKTSKRCAADVNDLVKALGLEKIQSEEDKALLYQEFLHAAQLYIHISTTDKRYSSALLGLLKMSEDKVLKKLGRDIYKAGYSGPEAVKFTHYDLWEKALKTAFMAYHPQAEAIWEELSAEKR